MLFTFIFVYFLYLLFFSCTHLIYDLMTYYCLNVTMYFQRFNVSVTRAKALLIVVGNPKILRHDKHWHQLLMYCDANGAYRGIKFPVDEPPDNQQDHIAS